MTKLFLHIVNFIEDETNDNEAILHQMLNGLEDLIRIYRMRRYSTPESSIVD